MTYFALHYTDEIRSRQGLSLLLDYYTPDGGSIRFKNIYNRTKRDYIEYSRNYPTTGEELYYTARDREQVINSYTSAITGENYSPWLKADWGASYAESRAHHPYDYEMDFT